MPNPTEPDSRELANLKTHADGMVRHLSGVIDEFKDSEKRGDIEYRCAMIGEMQTWADISRRIEYHVHKPVAEPDSGRDERVEEIKFRLRTYSGRTPEWAKADTQWLLARLTALEQENERLAQERALLYVGITTLDPVYSNRVTRYVLEHRTLPPPKSIVADELEKLGTPTSEDTEDDL